MPKGQVLTEKYVEDVEELLLPEIWHRHVFKWSLKERKILFSLINLFFNVGMQGKVEAMKNCVQMSFKTKKFVDILNFMLPNYTNEFERIY